MMRTGARPGRPKAGAFYMVVQADDRTELPVFCTEDQDELAGWLGMSQRSLACHLSNVRRGLRPECRHKLQDGTWIRILEFTERELR